MTKEEVLKKYFGYSSFRKGQAELIDSILDGRDTFGILPTSSGKSLCFQIPALMFRGITLVISPLISLMHDQVIALNNSGIHAAYLNSSLTKNQYYKALGLMAKGQYKIVYVAPERLLTESFLQAVAGMEISMVSVDEAHCISQWGQDFRPSYLKIAGFLERLKVRPVVSAFTATATRQVREDVVSLLGLTNPNIIMTGFDRKNLSFAVRHVKDRYGFVSDYVREHQGESGIIYCLTRKTVEEVTEKLCTEGFSATRYHAGLDDAERKRNQEAFIYDEKQIMVATNAFGMGIDKSNVRYVIHYNMPKDIESYYQEAGRAGRDSLPSECILLYGSQDVTTNQYLIDRQEPGGDMDQAMLEAVKEREREKLRRMTFYCFTSNCLREYILGYFGERAPAYCGNCSNCLAKFEETDITAEAAKIIGCVKSSRRSYGISMIINTVHGSSNAKIHRCRMDENPYYGSLRDVPVYQLQRIMNHLILNDFLALTNDEYPVLKLTARSPQVLRQKEPVLMKAAKDSNRTAGRQKKDTEKRNALSPQSGQADEELLRKLKELRFAISREEKVPPYIVFSDRTLIQMSTMKPRTKSEMLAVSGVGEMKFSKYGERFLKVISGGDGGYT